MAEEEPLRLEDLERKVTVNPAKNKVFRNSIEVRINPENPDAVAVFEAKIEARKLSKDYCSYGFVILTRYDKVTTPTPKKSIVSWFPYRTENTTVPVTKKKKVWSFAFSPFILGEVDSVIILCSGKRPTIAQGYKAALIKEAKDHGLIITPKLIETVFSPIDEQLEEKYQATYSQPGP